MKLACFNTQSPPQYVFNCCIITDTLIEFFLLRQGMGLLWQEGISGSAGEIQAEKCTKKKLSKQSRQIVEHLSGKWLPRESQGVDV